MELSDWFKGFENGIVELPEAQRVELPEAQRATFFRECGLKRATLTLQNLKRKYRTE